MNFKVDLKDENTFTFDFEGTAREANKLRHIFNIKIPVLGISEVNIRKNSSVFHDNYLIHRIQMIPVMKEIKDNLYLRKKGGILLSEDPLFPGIVIVKLAPHQEFEAELKTSISTGQFGVQWRAVNLCFFRKERAVCKFTVRSHGQYAPEKLFKMAMEIYEGSLDS